MSSWRLEVRTLILDFWRALELHIVESPAQCISQVSDKSEAKVRLKINSCYILCQAASFAAA